MKEIFKVSKTYSIVKPGSKEASNGEYSEEGFVYEDRLMDLDDLIYEIDSTGCIENYSPQSEFDQTLYSSGTQDMYTGDIESEALHIELSARLSEVKRRELLKEFDTALRSKGC